MDQYTVTGMSCAACQARVEKAVSKVPGVESCSVSLLTNAMGVEGNAAPADIIRAVEAAGYGASLKTASGPASGTAGGTSQNGRKSAAGTTARLAEQEEALKDHETPKLRRRLIVSAGFLLVLMYFSMGHMMWGWPLPAFFNDNHVAMGIVQMLLAGIVMVINQKFFTSGFRSLFHGAPNMDTLIALGSSAAFVYSTFMLLAMTRAQVDGNTEAVMRYMMEFYFESAAMILTLITVGKMLEAYSKGKTTNALKSLMKLAPKTATLVRDGKRVTVPIDEVCTGDVFVVKPGESIPVDGRVIEGHSAVNEAALTGESIPVDKAPGDEVSSATLNQSGFLTCEATRVGEDTTLSQIIQMVSDAAATKAPVARLADRISGVFVPAVICIALITMLVWLLVGGDIGFALAREICVLVVSCPCALGLATPVAIMVGNGMGAKNGILFKNAEALQETGNVQIIALDKTGTITSGEPVVTDIIPSEASTSHELIRFAVALEKKSEHPLAKAVVRYGEENQVKTGEVTDFTALPGNGLSARFNGRMIYGGNRDFISSKVSLGGRIEAAYRDLTAEGKTPMFFAEDDRLLGIIAVADAIKEDSAQAVRELQNMGIHVVMLTGDNERTAKAVGQIAGVNEVVAGVLPEGKENVIRQLMEYGKVAMVGDGINDAPALTRADIGIAIGAGTDVAIDAADVVLMKNSLTDVAAAVRLSRRTYRNIIENLFWALIYNTLLIPTAAGAYVKLLGITMNPMLGAAAMSLSSFCVVTNALRLNFMDVHDASKDKRHKKALMIPEDGKLLGHEQKEDRMQSEPEEAVQHTKKEISKGETEMTKTMKIEGMMCGHCEASVKKALENLDGVSEAVVSHESGTAVVTLSADVDNAVLTKAVEDRDYKVVGIEE